MHQTGTYNFLPNFLNNGKILDNQNSVKDVDVGFQ